MDSTLGVPPGPTFNDSPLRTDRPPRPARLEHKVIPRTQALEGKNSCTGAYSGFCSEGAKNIKSISYRAALGPLAKYPIL